MIFARKKNLVWCGCFEAKKVCRVHPSKSTAAARERNLGIVEKQKNNIYIYARPQKRNRAKNAFFVLFLQIGFDYQRESSRLNICDTRLRCISDDMPLKLSHIVSLYTSSGSVGWQSLSRPLVCSLCLMVAVALCASYKFKGIDHENYWV